MVYSRPAGAYAGSTGFNKTKYQDDSAAVPKVAIASAKVDGDINYVIDSLNDLDGRVLADGDKGDITVSSSGATWTIDNNAVTTAKIADDAVTLAKQASGTANRLQGFDGSGNPSEVSVSGATLSGGTLTIAASGSDMGNYVINRVQGSGQTSTSTTFTDITNHTVTITPSSVSKKVVIRANVGIGFSVAPTGNGWVYLRVARSDGTVVGGQAVAYQANGVTNTTVKSIEVQDSPATASAITYKLQFAMASSGTAWVGSEGASYLNDISAFDCD